MKDWDIRPWDIMIITAKYRENILSEHKGNLFIEALPDYCGEEAIKYMFTGEPEKIDRNKVYDFHELYLMINRLENFLLPFRYHHEFALILYDMVINGYKRRFCRGTEDQLKRIRELNEVGEVVNDDDAYSLFQHLQKKNGTVPMSLFIVGESGTGKTLTLNMLCQMFPDGIRHYEYKDQPITRLQIPCVKIDCPRNGSLMEICQRFFRQIDIIAGTNYLDKLSLGVRSISRTIIEMDRLALQYAVGVLIIDEIQNVLQTETKNELDQVLNFLVELSNTLGIPTVFVGTPESRALLKGRAAVIRRLTTEGEKHLTRFKQDAPQWDKFMENLWQYQYLPEYIPLSKSINDTFYKYTQGNVAQVVNLYSTVQKKALFEVNPIISCSFIDKVATEWFSTLKEMNEDLASGQKKRINKYRDLGWNYEAQDKGNMKLEESLNKTRSLYDNQSKVETAVRTDKKEKLILDMIAIGIFDVLDRVDIAIIAENIVTHNKVDESYAVLKELCLQACLEKVNKVRIKLQNKNKEVNKNISDEDDRYNIINLYDKAKKEKRHPKEVLEEYGYIISPIDEFLEDEE